jgi:hypothetical protein
VEDNSALSHHGGRDGAGGRGLLWLTVRAWLVIRLGLVVGIDTHLDVHVAAVLDRLGRRLAVRSFPATDAGNAQLIRWLGGLGTVASAGVEGTGSTAVPRDRDGVIGELRLLVITRRSAVKARTQASSQIKAFLLDAGDGLNVPWPASAATGWLWTPRPPSWKSRSSPWSPRRPRRCWTATASGPSAPPSSWSPQAPTPAGYAATPPWPPCAAPAPSRHPQARPPGTGSTAAATAPPTTPCGPSPTSA